MDNIEYRMPYGIQRPQIIISVGAKGWRNMVVEYFIIYPTNIVGFHLYQQFFFKNRNLLTKIKIPDISSSGFLYTFEIHK